MYVCMHIWYLFHAGQELTQYLVLDMESKTDKHETTMNYLYEAAEESSSSSSGSSSKSPGSSSKSKKAKKRKNCKVGAG
jgi:hypothetical protein